MRKALLVLSMFVLTGCTGPGQAPVQAGDPSDSRYRVVILTDMTHDDGNSLIRYLYYTPYFDTEAIIVTPQLPDFNHDSDVPWEKARGILDAYRQERDQLLKHDPGFPTYEALAAVTKRGRGALPIIWLTEDKTFAGDIAGRYVESAWGDIRFDDWIGEGLNPNGEPRDSEGSDFLQEVFDRDDDRPIYVQSWGGPITLVQALYRYEQRQGPEKLQALLARLHVYSIHLQDITFDYFIDLDTFRTTECAHLGETRSTYKGKRISPRWFLIDMNQFWQYIRAMDPSKVSGHGPMSALYDGGGEGDTPAFLYLISGALGLNDPQDPTHGSWGNLFYPIGDPFPTSYYHTCPGDSEDLERWIPDATNSFLNRLQWSTKAPDEVNHAPVAVLNGDEGREVLHLQVNAGDEVQLDASNSYDPDGDTLRFNWFPYTRAGSYTGKVVLADPASARQSIVVPGDLGDRDVHLVLEVRDGGSPELVAYRRVIMTGSGR